MSDFCLTSPKNKPSRPTEGPPPPLESETTPNNNSIGGFSFNAIAEATAKFQRDPHVTSDQQRSAAMMLMMARFGELASFTASSQGATSLSAFEQTQVNQLVASILIGVCGLGGTFDVDLDSSVRHQLQQMGVDVPPAASMSSPSPAKHHHDHGPRGGRPAPLDSLLTDSPGRHRTADSVSMQDEQQRWAKATGGSTDDAVLLSPQTGNNFRPMLEALIRERSTFTEAEFERVGLTFVAVSEDNRVIELIENGRQIPVTLQRFDEYLDLLRQRGILTLQPVVDNSPAVVRREDGLIIKKLHIDYGFHDPDAERKLYSPDHFDGGIFSPHTAVREVEVAYVDPDAPRQPQFASSPPSTRPAVESSQGHASTTPGSPQAHRNSFSATPQYHDENERDFWQKFRMLEHPERLSDDDFAQLDFRFTMPHNESTIELCEDGAALLVSRANCEGFVRLVKEQLAVFDGKVKRMPSVKAHVVKHTGRYDPKTDHARYSPGHKEGDLFAPEMVKTTFYIDHAAQQQLLPKALRKQELPVLIPTPSHYLEYITQHPEEFPAIIAAVQKRPSLVTRWNVTYCVPDPSQRTSGPQGGVWGLPQGVTPRCGVRDLIVPRGRTTVVSETEVGEFLRKVMEVSRSLPKCVAPTIVI